MNRSKPSTVVGGGEMKRVTSSVVSSASSAGASGRRSSRKVNRVPLRTGSVLRQSEVTIGASPTCGGVIADVSMAIAWFDMGLVARTGGVHAARGQDRAVAR